MERKDDMFNCAEELIDHATAMFGLKGAKDGGAIASDAVEEARRSG